MGFFCGLLSAAGESAQVGNKFCAEELARFSGEPEVVITGNAGFAYEVAFSGRWIGAGFEDCSAFVEFIKHGDVKHFGSRFAGPPSLDPEEFTTKAGDVVELGFLAADLHHILPAETGEGDGEEVDFSLTTPRDVLGEGFGGIICGAFWRVVASHCPGADYIDR